MAGLLPVFKHDNFQHIDNKEDTKMDKLSTKPSSSPRKNVRHGIPLWLRTGKINPSIRGYKKIQKYLMDLEAQLIEDIGGQANLTAAKEILVRSTIRGYGVVMLAELYASRYSILRPDDVKRGVMTFQPILERSYANIFGQIRQNLVALGLERREPVVQDVLEYIAKTYPDKPREVQTAEKTVDEKPQD
jgi:hypothetical protein